MDKKIFFISNYNYLTSKDLIDVKEIPSMVRRRLNLFDKAGVSVLNKSYKEDVESLIFSSEFGEVERLAELISQIEDYKEVSPNCFSGSVHNYLSGFFTSLIKKNIPYQAVCSGENSLSFGLIQAIVSKYNNVLYCYNDTYNEITSLSLIISKTKSENGFECRFIKNHTEADEFNKSEFHRFIDFLDKKENTFKSSLYTIERLD